LGREVNRAILRCIYSHRGGGRSPQGEGEEPHIRLYTNDFSIVREEKAFRVSDEYFDYPKRIAGSIEEKREGRSALTDRGREAGAKKKPSEALLLPPCETREIRRG